MSPKTRSVEMLTLPQRKKLYAAASTVWGLYALIEIRNLLFRIPVPEYARWHWLVWIGILTFVGCVWFFFEFWRSLSNRLEKAFCASNMAYFASLIPVRVHSYNPGWFRWSWTPWISAASISMSAIFVSIRTFQVLKQSGPSDTTN